MEENERETLPTEVWCHIFTFVDDFDDIMSLKIINRLFYQEVSARNTLAIVDKALKISEEMRKWFRNRVPPGISPVRSFSPADDLNATDRTQKSEITFRVVFIGTPYSGKTTFLTRLVEGVYKDDIEPTYGARFVSQKRKELVPEANGLTCRLSIWDISGVSTMNDTCHRYFSRVKSVTLDLSLINVAQKEMFNSIALTYVRQAHVIFLTFSLDDRDSFVTSINRWLPQLHQTFQHYDPQSQPIIYLLGLKSDLERDVSTSQVKALARVLKIKYFECSAKLNENVNEVMEEVKNDLLKTVRVPSLKGSHAVNAKDRRCLIQ